MKNFCSAVVLLVSGMFDSLFYEIGEGINKRDRAHPRQRPAGAPAHRGELHPRRPCSCWTLRSASGRGYSFPPLSIAVIIHYSKKDEKVKEPAPVPVPDASDLKRSAQLTRRPLRLCMYAFVNEPL